MSNKPNTTRSQFSAALAAISFPAFVALLLALALFQVGQLSDLIVTTESNRTYLLLYGLGLIYFTFMVWWTCRQILDFCTFVDAPDNNVVYDPAAFWKTNVPTPEKDVNFDEYYGGKIGFYLPRLIPLLSLCIVFYYSSIAKYWYVSAVTFTVGIVMLFILSKRRDWYKKGERHTILVARHVWHGIVATLVVIPAIFAVWDPQAYANNLGGLTVAFVGLGGLIAGSMFIVHMAVIPFWNCIFTLAYKYGRPVFKSAVLTPPYPIAFAFVSSAIVISYCFQTDNHAYRIVTKPHNTEVSNFDRQFDSLSQAFQLYKKNNHLNVISVADGEVEAVPVFFIANQGGGLRASYWSNAILSAFEGMYPGFYNNVFLMSGASGGTLGNILYVSEIASQNYWQGERQSENEECLENVSNWLQGNTDGHTIEGHSYCLSKDVHSVDHLAPVLTSFLYNDLMYRFVQFDFLKKDRAYHLEKSFENAFSITYGGNANPLSMGYQALYNSVRENQWLPIALGTTAIQELGLLALVSPFEFNSKEFPRIFDLHNLQAFHQQYENQYQQAYKALPWMEKWPFDDSDFDPKLEDIEESSLSLNDIPLVTTAINSARFPYVTPKGTLFSDAKYNRKLHTADAGYLDNYGAITISHAIDVLQDEFYTLDNSEKPRIYVPIILVLKNSPDYFNTLQHEKRANDFQVNNNFTVPDCHSSIAVNELAGPLQAFAAGRSGHADKRLTELLAKNDSTYDSWMDVEKDEKVENQDSLRKLAASTFDAVINDTTLVFEYTSRRLCETNIKEPPLGWYLSKSAQESMDQQVREQFVKLGLPLLEHLNRQIE